MHLTTRNVNTAFQTIVEGIENRSIPTIKTPSRNGPVLQIPEPVIITYTNPRERVLFNRARDCNPFFHLYESMWMLAGRNDVASLKYYASKIDQFSDDSMTFNGAYGYRWRQANLYIKGSWFTVEGYYGSKQKKVDQLDLIIDHLKRKPESRRVVLQMWNVEDDLIKIDSSKDVCCNLSVMFSIRTGDMLETGDGGYQALDMTVTNRSNDIIWGMLGANVVHFSFLQEYIACALGVEVGVYNQMSNNAHVYTETNSGWHPEKWLSEHRGRTMHSPMKLAYPDTVSTSIPLFTEDDGTVGDFDSAVKEFVEINKNNERIQQEDTWSNTFLRTVAQPMMHAWHLYKQKDFEASLYWCSKIAGDDWRIVCTEWIERRKESHLKKVSGDQ